MTSGLWDEDQVLGCAAWRGRTPVGAASCESGSSLKLRREVEGELEAFRVLSNPVFADTCQKAQARYH